MTIDGQGSECVARHARWAALWNGQLEIPEQLMAEKFVANLIADRMMPPEETCAALRGWVQAVRSRLSRPSDLAEMDPPGDGGMVMAGTLRAPDGTRIASTRTVASGSAQGSA